MKVKPSVKPSDNILPQFSTNPNWENQVRQEIFKDTLDQIRASLAGNQEQLAKLEGAGEIHIAPADMADLSDAVDSGMTQAMENLNQPAPAPEGGQVTTIERSTPVSVTVNIENAVTEDSESMGRLADQVADRITPAIEQAVGSEQYAY